MTLNAACRSQCANLRACRTSNVAVLAVSATRSSEVKQEDLMTAHALEPYEQLRREWSLTWHRKMRLGRGIASSLPHPWDTAATDLDVASQIQIRDMVRAVDESCAIHGQRVEDVIRHMPETGAYRGVMVFDPGQITRALTEDDFDSRGLLPDQPQDVLWATSGIVLRVTPDGTWSLPDDERRIEMEMLRIFARQPGALDMLRRLSWAMADLPREVRLEFLGEPARTRWFSWRPRRLR